ncbi:MAG: hypothetical protein ABI587_15730 [Gemmatimonadales bacterium]
MAKATTKLLVRGKKAARGAYDRLETKVMAATGRRVLKSKVKTVKKVGGQAARAALVAGALAAAGVVIQQIGKRRKSPGD